MDSDSLPIGEALRLIRTRKGLTQVAASKLTGAPDYRTLSHWETGRKSPSLRLLSAYLGALGLDFADLQKALDHVRPDERSDLGGLAGLGRRVETIGAALIALESRLRELEAG